MSSISEPDVNEVNENVDGPVIEIPPLDDVKLFSAIMNSQNNNDPDLESSFQPGSDSWSIPRARSPGDGMEKESDKTDGNTNNSKQMITVSKENIGKSKEKPIRDTNDKDYLKNCTVEIKGDDRSGSQTKTREVSETSKTKKEDNQTSGGTVTASHSNTGIFTKLIEAKVSDIVSAGEQIETDEKHSDQKKNKYKDGRDVFNFSENADKSIQSFVDLYSGESVLDEPEKEKEESLTNKIMDDIPEVPSIYSRTEESDLSCDEDTESFCQSSDPALEKSRMSNNSTPSKRSKASTPVSDIRSLVNAAESRHLAEDLDKISVSSDKGLIGYHRPLKSPYSDSALYGKLSNRNTPDMVSANQNRCKSAMSNSSANDTEEEQAANKILYNRSSSRLSANDVTGYGNSPCPSTDDEKLSINTHSSTQSPSTDLEGKYFSICLLC